MQWIQQPIGGRAGGRSGKQNQEMKKGKTSAYSNLKKGMFALSPLSNHAKDTSRGRQICESEGKYNVIIVNSSDTSAAFAPRNKRRETLVKSNEHKKGTISQRKTRPTLS